MTSKAQVAVGIFNAQEIAAGSRFVGIVAGAALHPVARGAFQAERPKGAGDISPNRGCVFGASRINGRKGMGMGVISRGGANRRRQRSIMAA